MNARRLPLTILGALLCVLALAASPAQAAAPEAPETSQAESVTGSSAVLSGYLDPHKRGGPGTFEILTYQFLYKASATECQGGSETTEGMSLGEGYEHVTQEIAGLEPHTQYSFCLVARSGGQETVGAPVTFTTAGEVPETGPVTGITGTTATFHGVVNPHHPAPPNSGFDEFLYLPSATECERAGNFESAGGAQIGEMEAEAVEATATGLLPDTTYTVCLAAGRYGEVLIGQPVTFKTPAVSPTIGSEAASAIGSTEALLTATIEPGGLPTDYIVEYGSTVAYGSVTPSVSAGASGESVPVRVRLSSLQAGSEYHFRFVASNELGRVDGSDDQFTTTSALGTSSSLLPDGRRYELVSSPTNNQAVDSLMGLNHLGAFAPNGDEASRQPFRAAGDGDAIAFPGGPGAEGGNGSQGSEANNEWLASRGASGWTSTDITPPGSVGSTEYMYFSEDLSTGVLLSEAGAPIAATPSAPACTDLFARTTDGLYHALVTERNAEGSCGFPKDGEVSGDGSHLLFEDDAALTAGAKQLSGRYLQNIYDSVDGVLHQVNVLPDGEPEQGPGAWLGAPPSKENAPADSSEAVSFDGSRVFWSSVEAVSEYYLTPTALYVRENDAQPQSPIGADGQCTVSSDACTVQVDAAEPQCLAAGNCKSGDGSFWTASKDGSRVIFTDENRLTSDSTAALSEPDLYAYEVNAQTGKPGTLIDLTGDQGGAHADVQGVIGSSEDGSDVYFVADGVLTKGQNAEGREPIGGEPNLYLSQNGVTSFVVTLAPGDGETPSLYNENKKDWSHAQSNRTAAVTPNGRDAVFESRLSLTGYQNTGPQGESVKEVFIYDAQTARIVCASCSPNGAAPSEPVGGFSFSPLPVPGSGEETMEEYAQRWLSSDGNRVFFDTTEPLVPQDTNGLMDVYEWERNGAGSCPPTESGQVERGCVYLLSGGQSSGNAYFADADDDGNNVFFTSREHLAPQVGGEHVAMFDARVDGGFPELATECAGAGCQGVPPAPPIFASPASATFNGVGNFEPGAAKLSGASKTKKKSVKCGHGHVRRRGKCVKRKAVKAKRSAASSKKGRTR